jgi:predicted SnoaL-like aldol condensation-catalyzing enzyme
MVKKLLSSLFLIIALLIGGNAMAQSEQEKNLAIIGQFANVVFVNKDLSQLDTFMKKNYIQHNPLVSQGQDGFYTFFDMWFKSSPDFNYNLKKIIANGDEVWVYGTYSGTQTGDWLGISATNAQYKFDAVDIFRIEDGKLAEHWDVLDVYNLFKQLGTLK